MQVLKFCQQDYVSVSPLCFSSKFSSMFYTAGGKELPTASGLYSIGLTTAGKTLSLSQIMLTECGPDTETQNGPHVYT